MRVRANVDSVPTECDNNCERAKVQKVPNPVLEAGTFLKRRGH